jgi:2'-5' RNA ligase
VGGDERLRLFLALRLPDAVLDRIEAWQRVHISGGRPVPRENLHVTLAFLGHRPESELPVILREFREAVRRAHRPTFTLLRYRETPRVGMLVFEDRRNGTVHGLALASDLQRRMESLGIALRERVVWRPHVTVVRFRERPGLRPPLPELGEVTPSDAAAFLSRLSPSGAQYEVLESVALGG